MAKALGAPSGLSWHDCEIVSDPDGRPWLTVTGTVAAAAAERGITRWHLSLSHDGGIASAMLVAEAGVEHAWSVAGRGRARGREGADGDAAAPAR